MKSIAAGIGIILLSVIVAGGPATAASRTFKISHQFPAAESIEKGDYRDRLAKKFAAEVAKRTNDEVRFEVYPAASLVKPLRQFTALSKGALDLSVLPFAYAAGQMPEASVTVLPGLVTSYKQGLAWRNNEIGKEIEKALERNGVKMITWIWESGASVATKPLVKPSDYPGSKVRGPGKEVNALLVAAGAGIASLPSSETYSALQSGVVDGVWTATASLTSFRLYEFAKNVVITKDEPFYFSFLPLLMSKAAFDSLTPQQQKVILDVGRELDEFAATEAAKGDKLFIETYTKAGATIHVMDDATKAEWLKLAKASAWKDFAEQVRDGARLIELATQAK
jgi:TRAP-type C4-dicarboxylate transport system substrate-binding protein